MDPVTLPNQWSADEIRALFFVVVKYGHIWQSIMLDEEFRRVFQTKKRTFSGGRLAFLFDSLETSF